MADTSPTYFDTRWNGPHGIGRFSAELQSRVNGLTPLDIAGPKLSIADPLAISLALRGRKSGCYLSPGFNPPLRSPIPVVFTIHDLIHLHVPQESTLIRRAYYAMVVRPGAKRAAKVLTVSEFSRQRIVDWAGINPDNVVVVGNGVSAAFAPPRQATARTHFLHVGRRAAHKNIRRMLQAFGLCRSRQFHEMLFTGTPDSDTLAAAAEFGVLNRIRFAGQVDDVALAKLYHQAVALVFPSTYEGFGLPIVEAMGCGTPVITAAATSTSEVSGDAALLFDPLDVDALAAAMDRVAEDSLLQQHLSASGVTRSRAFRWDAVAARVERVLEGLR